MGQNLTANGSDNASARFGTFAGVFTPNVLTILGIILFLRMGEVTANTGLWHGLIIVLIANAVSLLTGFSLSAVATNMRVRAGGKYYMISRSLGLEVGGAIGIPLYLSQAISVAFYIIGFTEALRSLDIFAPYDPQLIASAVAVVFILIAYAGADFALRIQFVILAILIASLLGFFGGALRVFGSVDMPQLSSNYQPGESFWTMFALFFPAVTGIGIGASLSGDLKDPSHSIPLGTIASIIFTGVIYVAVVVVFVFTLPVSVLLTDNLAMQQVALFPPIILAGVWASTLSSALGSILAAPRTLQAIARDGVVPKWMSANLGSKTEPRAAVLLTGGVTFGVIWAGDLNAVAPIISMFFLNTYGMVNLAAGIERLVNNPSYRPRFRVPFWVSLLGALGCYGTMFLISPAATIIAIAISLAVFFALQRRSISRTWGDIGSGVWFALARFALLNLESNVKSDPKNWRPNLMVFTGQPHNRRELVEVADWLSLGQGIVTFFQLIVQPQPTAQTQQLRETAERSINRYIAENHMKAFAEADVVDDFHSGVLTIAQAHGVGNLESNTVLFGWSQFHEGRTQQLKLLLRMIQHKKSVLFLNYDDTRGFGNRRVINVWWRGRGGNEDLMLLLAHFISRHRSWDSSTVRLLRVVDNQDGVEPTRTHMDSIIKSARVPRTETMVVVREDRQQPLAEVIEAYSADADFTILGMHLPAADEVEAYSHRLNDLVQSVGSVLLVRNAHADQDLLSDD